MENHEIVYEGKTYELVENNGGLPCHNCDLSDTKFSCEYNTKCSVHFVYKLKKDQNKSYSLAMDMEAGSTGICIIKGEEKDMKDTFTVTIDSKEYSVKPFSLIDIYMKDPDKEWFVNIMNDWYEFDYTPFLRIIDEYVFSHFNFQDNLQWMIDNSFMEEIVKETLLEQGMILTRDSGAEYMCIDEDEDGFRLVCIKEDCCSVGRGRFIRNRYKTLEGVCIGFHPSGLYIKEEKENK